VSLAAAPSIDHRARWPRARALYLLRVFTIATRSFRAALTLSRFRHDEFDRITGGDDRPKHQPPAASALLTFRVNMVFGCTSTAEEDDTRTLGRNDRAVDPSRRFLRMGSKRKRERERDFGFKIHFRSLGQFSRAFSAKYRKETWYGHFALLDIIISLLANVGSPRFIEIYRSRVARQETPE
jgi:hypothetical protein